MLVSEINKKLYSMEREPKNSDTVVSFVRCDDGFNVFRSKADSLNIEIIAVFKTAAETLDYLEYVFNCTDCGLKF